MEDTTKEELDDDKAATGNKASQRSERKFFSPTWLQDYVE